MPVDPTLVLLTVFGIFIPALILPGPDFVGVVRMSMTRGAAAGIATAAGVALMLGVYATASLIGLAAILVEYQWLTWLVRIAGGAYLVYLGIQLVRAQPTDETLSNEPAGARGNPFLFGVLVTLTNPKAVVLFASVFATAVTADTPGWLLATMVALVMVSALVWYVIVASFMSSGPVMRRFARARHWIERAAGVCFIGIGGRIIADARSPVMP
jgi:threonine/homoserine/homoserine lactone efflux protein